MKKIIFGVLILAGCATTPPDFPTCVDLSNKTDEGLYVSRGYCIWTISKAEQEVDDDNKYLNGQNWTTLRRKALLIPATSWTELKEYILKHE